MLIRLNNLFNLLWFNYLLFLFNEFLLLSLSRFSFFAFFLLANRVCDHEFLLVYFFGDSAKDSAGRTVHGDSRWTKSIFLHLLGLKYADKILNIQFTWCFHIFVLFEIDFLIFVVFVIWAKQSSSLTLFLKLGSLYAIQIKRWGGILPFKLLLYNFHWFVVTYNDLYLIDMIDLFLNKYIMEIGDLIGWWFLDNFTVMVIKGYLIFGTIWA